MIFLFREVLDSFLRNRAASYGANLINGLFLRMESPKDKDSPYVLHYSDYAGDSKVCLNMLQAHSRDSGFVSCLAVSYYLTLCNDELAMR